jgi:SAM-dependent methyltransferase
MANTLIRALARWLPLASFKGSEDYWRRRYRLGGDSGVGSAGEAASYKATVLNDFVAQKHIQSVIEFGCGDGRQLDLAEYPDYLGIDISPEVVAQCKVRFAGDSTKKFIESSSYAGQTADLSMSLDVIYHLVEDATYEAYLRQLFAASSRFVIVYSSDLVASNGNLKHIRHRAVGDDVAARFPGFARLTDVEAALPAPVAFNRGVPTSFLVFERQSPDVVNS